MIIILVYAHLSHKWSLSGHLTPVALRATAAAAAAATATATAVRWRSRASDPAAVAASDEPSGHKHASQPMG